MTDVPVRGYERAPFSTPFFIHDRGDTWVKRL